MSATYKYRMLLMAMLACTAVTTACASNDSSNARESFVETFNDKQKGCELSADGDMRKAALVCEEGSGKDAEKLVTAACTAFDSVGFREVLVGPKGQEKSCNVSKCSCEPKKVEAKTDK